MPSIGYIERVKHGQLGKVAVLGPGVQAGRRRSCDSRVLQPSVVPTSVTGLGRPYPVTLYAPCALALAFAFALHLRRHQPPYLSQYLRTSYY